MYRLVIVRHGQSQWNEKNLFTGWADVDLTEKGIAEAKNAGELLNAEGFEFDIAYTSVLKRAIRTLNIMLTTMDQHWIPVNKRWQLNEKSYGALTGLNKVETAEKYGAEQVLLWRRSYDIKPPLSDINSEYHPANDKRYVQLTTEQKTAGESLEDTVARIQPVWHDEIAPAIKAGKQIIIAAHGNSLRALLKTLNGMSNEEILQVNVPTGTPLVIKLDENLKLIESHYLGNQDAIEAEMKAVANQGSVKG